MPMNQSMWVVSTMLICAVIYLSQVEVVEMKNIEDFDGKEIDINGGKSNLSTNTQQVIKS